jgi:Uma2 family endonuclease
MAASEIVLPITEPETEWVRGRPLQKVSPTRSHSLLQGRFTTALAAWAGDRGEVGPEWRFRVAPPGGTIRPLVPDIAYVAVERLRGLTGHALEVPQLAPDVAVEILSPDDRRPDVDDKIATYLASGSALVIVIDPQHRQVELHDREGTAVQDAGMLAHPAVPGFAISIHEMFRAIDPPR